METGTLKPVPDRAGALYGARTWALAVCLQVLGAASASAQANEALQFFEEEARVLAAAKHPQRISEAPATAQIITAEDIATYGYRTLGEALQSLPGIFAAYDRNYTELWVRGFGRPGDYSNRVLVLLNGHRLNDNIFGQAFFSHDFSLDLAGVDHIEVVKGPGSALFGDNAFFAVVNVVTRTARSSPPARARVDAGSYGTHEEFAELSHEFSDRSGLYADGSYRYMRGQDLFYPEFQGVDHGVAADADREESYTLYSSWSRPGWLLQGNINNRNKRVPTAPFGTRFDDNGTYTSDSRGFVELAMQDRQVHDAVALSGRWYYDWYGYHANFVGDNPFFPPPPERGVDKDLAKAAWYGEELRGRFTFFGEAAPFMLGEEFEKNLLGRQVNYGEDPHVLALDDNRTEYRWALFGQQELHLRPDLSATLGLRYDRYQTFGHTLNPRTALVYHPRPQSSLKLLYGSAFRAPTVFERYYAAVKNVANPELRPETIRTYEAAWEQEFGARRFVSLSYFQNRIKDLISQVPLAGGTLQYRNQDNIRTDGLELYGKAELAPGLGGHLGYTLQSTRFMGGDRLSNSPTHTANLGLSRTLPFWDARAAMEGFLLSRRTTTQGTGLPATAVLSLTASCRPGPEGLGVYASVNNVFDTDYRVSGGGEHLQSAIPQDGRNFTAGLEYRFGGRRAR